jgi:hypothetical protein
MLVPIVHASPSWMFVGAYVRYDQVFRWDGGNATSPMIWNVTSISGGLANVSVSSYDFDIVRGKVILHPVGAQWVVDMGTGKIVQVVSGPGVVGKAAPFWIDPAVNEGSTIDAYFGATAQIQRADPITALGQTRDCWKVVLSWPSATMQRWYDKSAGIVLMIDTSFAATSPHVEVTETAVASNIQIPTATPVTTQAGLIPYVVAVILVTGVVFASVVYLRIRARGRRPPSASEGN